MLHGCLVDPWSRLVPYKAYLASGHKIYLYMEEQRVEGPLLQVNLGSLFVALWGP